MTRTEFMLNRFFFLSCCILIQQYSFGQLAEPLFFDDKIHDFGEVEELTGPVTYDFSFLNKSNRPVKILNVQPSCGCTTPGWSKEAIAVGKTGFIKASFDPKGRPGYFNKSLTISTDMDGNSILLQIKGNVVNTKSDKGPAGLMVENGNFRFRNSSFNVGKVFTNKKSVPIDFSFYNTGNDTIKIKEVLAPTYIKVSIPKSIAPLTKGTIKILYDAGLRNQYGFCSDNILIKTSDIMQPEKSFSVYATVEEYFPALSPEEQAVAPILKIENYELDFGKIKFGTTVQRSIKFKNKGKKELLVRYAQSNCSCLVSSISKMKLKPNEEGVVELLFDSSGREGLQNKALTIYSNDPINPVQRILLKGYIDSE